MIAATPASMAARKGSSSPRPAVRPAVPRCESTCVSPCPGKCLAQASTPPDCVPLTNAATCRATSSGSDAERAHADHRVLRVRVHVRDRCEVHRHAHRAQVVSHRPRHCPGQLRVVDGAERQVARVGTAGLPLEPGDVAALLVEGDHDVRASRRSSRRQPGELLRVDDVGRVQADAAEPAVEVSAHPVRRLPAREAGEEAARRPSRAITRERRPRSTRMRCAGARAERTRSRAARSASPPPSAGPSRCRGRS